MVANSTFQALGNTINQDCLAILRAENEVIFERKDSASIACIPLMFHAKSIAVCSMNNNYLTEIVCLPLSRGMRNWPTANLQFPCQLKQAVPLKGSYGSCPIRCQTQGIKGRLSHLLPGGLVITEMPKRHVPPRVRQKHIATAERLFETEGQGPLPGAPPARLA